MNDDLIDELARLRGIGDAYHDFRGQLHYFSRETKAGILRAMDGVSASAIPPRRLVPLVAASTSHRIGIDLLLGGAEVAGTLRWTLCREDGTRHQGSIPCATCAEQWSGEANGQWISRRRFDVPIDLPLG